MKQLALTKLPNGIVFFFTLLLFSITANLAFAGIKVFIEDYTYQASKADCKLSSRTIASEQVKRLLLEELATYLESETEVRNFRLTKEQIIILTAGIVRVEIIDENWDGKEYSLKAKIEADPKEVIKSIDHLRQDSQKTKALEEARKKAYVVLEEVKKLKREMGSAQDGKAEQDQYTKAINALRATDWFERGITLENASNVQEAMEAFDKAIELDPQAAWAYYNRGLAYGKVGDYRQAIRDFDKVIELNPQAAWAYKDRGAVYDKLGSYRVAIRDFDKAIELDPKVAWSYYNRGVAYMELGSYRVAIRDFDKAIELDPEAAWAYKNRGAIYDKLGSYRQAIKDYDRVIKLDPKDAGGYYNRGIAYGKLGDYQQAIRDFDKAIQLNPKVAWSYYNRGIAYGKVGNYRQAIEDFKIAARLGHKKSQNYLRSKGIRW